MTNTPVSKNRSRYRKTIRVTIELAVIAGGVLYYTHLIRAGSLTPSASPAATMRTVEEVYNSLASSSFSNSGLASDFNGSAIEIAKCAITKIEGGSCN